MEIFMILVSCMIAAFPILSVFKMHKTKSSEDQSWIGASFILFGVASWAGYGFYSGDPVVMWCNVGIFLAQTLMWITIAYYRRNRHGRQDKMVDMVDHLGHNYHNNHSVSEIYKTCGDAERAHAGICN